MRAFGLGVWCIYLVAHNITRRGEASRSVNEDLVTELTELERRIAVDEYTITLARGAAGNDANRVSLEQDLRRRVAT
jgi:hypothetical protein